MKIISRISKLILIAALMINTVGVRPAKADVKLPLLFKSNHGQTDASVKYYAREKGYTLFLTSSEALMELHKSASSRAKTGDIVRMKLEGANADPEFQGLDGNGQDYSSVMIKQVYPGIDMVYYGKKGQLEYDFIIAPGINPGLIRMGFQGTKNIALDKKGNLILRAEKGKLAFKAPVLYQETGTIKKFVDGNFVLAENNQVYFNVGAYDKTKELIIDPVITAISPTQGPPAGGTTVQITGSGFSSVVNPNGVTFGATNAVSYTVNSNTQITAISPAHGPGSVDIVVTDSSGFSSPFVPADTYTYAAIAPVITSVNPTQGPPSGGTTVTIIGWAFMDVIGAGGVTFGGTNATSYVVNSNTKITAIAPPNATGSVDVVVTSPAGSSPIVAADKYTYATAAPAITAVSPTGGPPYGGTTVIIAGSGFAGVTGPAGVTFDGTNAASYTVNSNTQITAISPVHAVGSVDIVVTSPAGSSPIVAADSFTYFTPAVAVTSVSPAQGPPAGGTTVIITGSGFIGVVGPSGITFGSINATSYVVNSNTQITAIAPAHAAGSVDVVATSPAGTSPFVKGDTYTYAIAPPTVTQINPNQGPTAGGTTVVITGTGFTGITAPEGVTFGGVNATSYTVDSNTQITAVSPAHAAGTVDVVMTSPSGSSPIVPLGQFTFIAPIPAPTIISLNPNNGPIAGGTTVVITGSDFTGVTGASGVTFGGTNAASYTVNSNTQITAVSPAHAAGSVDVVITSPAGASPIVPSDNYTFIAPEIDPSPSVLLVTSFTPIQGPSLGATTVVITGLGFTGVTGPAGVTFGGVNATSYVVDSDTQITTVSPAHPAGTVTIGVTNGTIPASVDSVPVYTYFLSASNADSYIFPSPIRGNTAQIAYTLSGPGFVKIRIYNEIGNLVDTVSDDKLAGPQTSTINTERFASGVYIYLLSVEYPAGNTQNYDRRKFVVAH